MLLYYLDYHTLMSSIKELLGLLAVALTIFSLLPYIVDILKKKTKPHLYTWVVWTPLTFMAFFGQVLGDAGPGAWTTGVTAMLCLVILALAIPYGTKNVTKSDNWSLVGVFIAGILWLILKNPVASIVLVTLIDVLAFIPTIRKSFKDPHEETLITHELSGAKHFISLFALDRISILTALYPAAVFLANIILVSVIITHRKKNG